MGSKSAQLGEMKSRLGLPAPEGFAISAWAYKHFVDANDLQSRITAGIRSVDIRRYEDLVGVSESLGAVVLVPSLKEIVTFVLMVVILIVRPQGLLGGRR